MYIHKFSVSNFMCHHDTEIRLYPITVLVGPNGAGKSALFDSLLNFSMVARGRLSNAFGPGPFSFQSTRYRGAQQTERITFEAEIGLDSEQLERIQYSVSYLQNGWENDHPEFEIMNERLMRLPAGREIYSRDKHQKSDIGKAIQLMKDKSVFASANKVAEDVPNSWDEIFQHCTRHIQRMNRWRLEPYHLSQPSRLPSSPEDSSDSPSLWIDYQGEDLATVLFFLSENDPERLEKISVKMRELDPAFDRFEFNYVGINRIGFSCAYSDARRAVPAARLSTGSLTFIGLIALTLLPSRPALMMIEEPENGLTPHAVSVFYRALKEMVYSSGFQTQVIVSSHSPYVICEAWNGESRDFIYQVGLSEGRSLVRPLPELIEEHGIHLQKERKQPGESKTRERLGLNLAEALMNGFYQT